MLLAPHAGAKLEITPSMGQGKTGISFKTADQLEAAGITWLEVIGQSGRTYFGVTVR